MKYVYTQQQQTHTRRSRVGFPVTTEAAELVSQYEVWR